MTLLRTAASVASAVRPGPLLAALVALGLAAAVQAQPSVRVYAAASVTDAMDAAIERYEADHDADIVAVYASSSTLARQIAQGAPADLFVSANQAWMDWLAAQGVALTARADLLHNRLVLVAPRQSETPAFTPGQGDGLGRLLEDGERLSVGDPDHVPAGLYARQALEALGEWDALAPRLARADNVRAALALVERGEAPLGIVYRTDAQASDRVRELGLFPVDSHEPIGYPVALVGASAGDAAAAFRAWLDGAQARRLFASHGFLPADLPADPGAEEE